MFCLSNSSLACAVDQVEFNVSAAKTGKNKTMYLGSVIITL
jgi:hypothetical protein